jgi:hypothetical protein
VTTRNYHNWTIDRWKVEPRFPSLEIDEPPTADQAPPLWKDLTLAAVVVLAVWVVVAVLFA